jgi:hypothetical protein
MGLAEGSIIIGAFLVIVFVVLAYSLYTRKGSGISSHPYADLDHDSGPETPEESTDEVSEEFRNMGRGTAGHHRRHRPP